MDDAKFLVREPLLDPKERMFGYELKWQGLSGDDNALASFIAAEAGSGQAECGLGDGKLFLQANLAALEPATLAALPPQNVIFCVSAAELVKPEVDAAAKSLRQAGFGIAGKYGELVGQDKSLLALVTHVEIDAGTVNQATLGKLAAVLKQASIQLVVRNVHSWPEFDACASLGLNAFVGDFYLDARPGVQVKGLNPAQTIILHLMQLVKQNADIRQLEDVLRRDAAISYKLLRYINSVGFGLGAEIQSLRHAVTMLGYSPLYRWLSLLLATASSGGHAPALMQTAVIRGRFAELLGQDFLPKNEAENLFVAGMFSLLDRLLGLPMEQVLESIQLSDAVSEALLTRGGMFGPFLALAEACERGTTPIEPLADSMFLSANRINEAHLAALAWAQALQL
ncbi:MAG TPA: HDOD domain-containing protein [Paucimonas sp.]|nr:HDOD domain-containing protein [Paucimonas sp.]